MYLYIITLGLCASYFILLAVFPWLLGKPRIKLTKKRVASSLLIIVVLSLFSYFLVTEITDPDIANRVLHAFGGGFLAFLVCFLVVKDSQLQIGKFQFLFLAALVVTALGVSNEIMEFLMQNYLGQIMAETINDTWLDLISNSVGLLASAVVFVPFL